MNDSVKSEMKRAEAGRGLPMVRYGGIFAQSGCKRQEHAARSHLETKTEPMHDETYRADKIAGSLLFSSRQP